MRVQSVTIPNRRGLHARAAAKVVTLSERFTSHIDVGYDGQWVPAASIMGLMMLGAGKGSVLTFRAEGDDADDAVASLVELIESGFSETD